MCCCNTPERIARREARRAANKARVTKFFASLKDQPTQNDKSFYANVENGMSEQQIESTHEPLTSVEILPSYDEVMDGKGAVLNEQRLA
jgi:hypothetical protein